MSINIVDLTTFKTFVHSPKESTLPFKHSFLIPIGCTSKTCVSGQTLNFEFYSVIGIADILKKHLGEKIQFIHTDADSLSKTLFEYKIDVTNQSAVEIYENYEYYELYHKMIVRFGNRLACGRPILYLLSCLLCFPTAKPFILDFIQEYKSVVHIQTDKDDDVFWKSFADPLKIVLSANPIDILKKVDDLPPIYKLTKGDIMFTIGVFILSMTKNVSNSAYYEAWLNKRITAWSGTLGSTVSKDCVPSFDDMSLFRNHIDYFPGLKQSLLRLLLNNQDKNGFQFILNLLSYSGMTGYVLMNNFIELEEKTFAHIMPSILSDARKFLASQKRLMIEFDDMFKYYKIINPQGDEFSDKSLPHLAYAAKEYSEMNKKINQYTRNNAMAPENSMYIRSALMKRLPRTKLATKQLEIYTDVLASMSISLEDLNKILARNQDQEAIGLTD